MIPIWGCGLNKRILALLLGGAFMSGVTYASSKSSDARNLVRLALNAPQVRQYFHFDKRPERVPLTIVNHSPFDLSPDFDVAGHKAKIISTNKAGEVAVEIQHIKIDDGSADLAF